MGFSFVLFAMYSFVGCAAYGLNSAIAARCKDQHVKVFYRWCAYLSLAGGPLIGLYMGLKHYLK
jgi:hypothetical protein